MSLGLEAWLPVFLSTQIKSTLGYPPFAHADQTWREGGSLITDSEFDHFLDGFKVE